MTSENNHIDIKVNTIIPDANPISLAGHNWNPKYVTIRRTDSKVRKIDGIPKMSTVKILLSVIHLYLSGP
jgi:hypothetical protein